MPLFEVWVSQNPDIRNFHHSLHAKSHPSTHIFTFPLPFDIVKFVVEF